MSRSLAAAALVACCVLQPAAAGWVESYDKKSNKKFYYDEETIRKSIREQHQWDTYKQKLLTDVLNERVSPRASPRGT